jgi:hypothetical protein
MSIEAIAKDLANLCRQGKNFEAIDKYYSDVVVSIESVGNEEMPAVMKGKKAVRGKNEWWVANNEVHSASVSEPMIGDTQFALHLEYDVTYKPAGQRMKMTEVALYTVKNGKISQEQFFYHMPGA